jgi:hypothetical protein
MRRASFQCFVLVPRFTASSRIGIGCVGNDSALSAAAMKYF